MPQPLRLVHCADVHLDSDYYGGARGAAQAGQARAHFAALLAQTASLRAHLLVIAGDLFDHNRVSADTLAFTVDALAGASCPVVILPGNHDCLAPDAVLAHPAWEGSGVHRLRALDGETLHFEHLDLTLWGRAMQDHTPQFRPLAHVPARAGDGWHIGLAHGLVREEEDALRSAPIAPHEIAASGFDYLALGHVHAPREVSAGGVTAWYPGNTLPFGRQPGTALCVDLLPGAPAQVRTLHVLMD